MKPSDFAVDLDGSGKKTSNRLPALLGWLNFESIGAIIPPVPALLLEEQPGNLDNADCASVTTWVGHEPASPPAYDGSDVFSIDSTVPSGTITGPIVDRLFKSTAPFRLQTNNQIHVLLPIIMGAQPVRFDLSAAYVQFQRSDGRIVAGQIDGALDQSDFQNSFLPAMAKATEGNERARRLMDVGDGKGHPCESSDGTLSVPGDGVVGVCEVADNLWPAFVQPDVQLFDSDGNYHPTRNGKHPDSISIGFGFTAVPATF